MLYYIKMSSLLQQIKSLNINKQNTLEAGDNISIVGNVISSLGSTTNTTSSTENKIEGGGNKSGKISRIKKATKWRDFAKDTANDGLELAQKATDPFKNVKSLFGGQVKPKRAPSQWIQFVKEFASKHNIPYKEALKKAGPAYHKL